MELEIKINHTTRGIVTVSPVGSINTETSIALDKEIEEVLTKPIKVLVLDMEGVDFITSAGVGIIVKIKTSLNRKGYEFAMINLKPQIKKVFEILRLTPILDVFTSKKELDEYLFRVQRNITGDEDSGC